MPRILFVFTSADSKTDGSGKTGYWLSEAAHPYYLLASHAEIDFAAPKGANPPLDPGSVALTDKNDTESHNFMTDETVLAKFASAKKLTEVDASRYDVVYFPGGHGPVIDLAFDADNAKLASTFFQSGKIVAAVCHGPAALVGATDAAGKSIFSGRRATAFSNAEEAAIKGETWIPFLPEDKIKELGAVFEKASEPFASFVVQDANLITGQNPASAAAVGQAILAALKA
ncbi:ThiJ/PfpI [Auriculariales sp. MPI-PUGE-AT-0066]|nr:ThiJ/PfpI [Auriculariales sp. MPI-PUGE-AT-0066]